MQTWLIGVDEAGRGPLAGPIAVGAVLVPLDFDWELLSEVGDSKQLSQEQRERVYAQAKQLRQAGRLRFSVAMSSAQMIDAVGIVPAIKRAMARALQSVLRQEGQESLLHPEDVLVKLDGGLVAPKQYVRQETVIRGDQTELSIGLASIVAKVQRDRYMGRLAKRADLAPYDFAQHKGYGTKAHRAAIERYGLSSQHRQSYCRNLRLV